MRRLAYYLTGLALGCLLLGLYFQGRQAYVARRQAEQAAAAQADAERARPAAQAPGGPAGAVPK